MDADLDVDLDGAVERLYGAPPEGFVALRTELTRAARSAGDRDLAARIAALRRPTAAAGLLNRLSRDDPAAIAALRAVGDRLRQAQRDGDGAAIRALGAQRRTAIAAALRAVDVSAAERGASISAAVRAEVEASLASAVLDPASADAIAGGRLTEAVQQVGFGDWSAPAAGADAGGPVPRPALRAVPDLPPRRAAAQRAAERADQAERERARRRAAAVAKAEAAGSALDEAQEQADAAQERVEQLQDRIDQLRAELVEATAAARAAHETQRRAARDARSALRRLADRAD